MTQSMTGFSTSTVEITISETEKLSFSIGLKSLNSRYFEVTCKLPYLLSNLEVNIQRALKKKLLRGHVFVGIKIQQDQTNHVVVPAIKTVQEYVKAIQQIKDACNLAEPISLNTILQLPNILQVEDSLINASTEEQMISAINQAADQLIKTRIHEGSILAQDVLLSMNNISKYLATVITTSKNIHFEKKNALDDILKKLDTFDAGDNSIEKTMLEQQKNTLLLDLEKIDIHEEIIRASTHIASVQNHMNDQDICKGKKLDFTLQELNREINTIASKCSNSSISSLTIDIKTEIEKAREQAQNIL